MKLQVKHLPSDYAKDCTEPCGHSNCDPVSAIETQEVDWGEERTNDED